MGTDGRTGVGRPDGDDEDGDGDEDRLAYCTYIHSYITFLRMSGPMRCESDVGAVIDTEASRSR